MQRFTRLNLWYTALFQMQLIWYSFVTAVLYMQELHSYHAYCFLKCMCRVTNYIRLQFIYYFSYLFDIWWLGVWDHEWYIRAFHDKEAIYFFWRRGIIYICGDFVFWMCVIIKKYFFSFLSFFFPFIFPVMLALCLNMLAF